MSELSIFIDESGDFGPYDYRSPYYIITMVFHDQSVDISGPIAKLNQDLANRGFPYHCVHTGPIIRRENEYEFESLQTRRRILNSILDADDLIMAVVECKASLIGIDEAAHAQAENYLREINTRYFFVTDGVRFSGYYFDTQQFIKLEKIPQYEEWYWYPKA